MKEILALRRLIIPYHTIPLSYNTIPCNIKPYKTCMGDASLKKILILRRSTMHKFENNHHPFSFNSFSFKRNAFLWKLSETEAVQKRINPKVTRPIKDKEAIASD